MNGPLREEQSAAGNYYPDLEVTAPLAELSSLVAAQGADAVALRPAELRVRVVSILTAAEEAVR